MSADASIIFEEAKARLGFSDFRNARRLMKLAAKLDHLPAMRMYAAFVENGIGGNKNVLKAMHWFERLGSRGDKLACAHLGQWLVTQGQDAKAKFWLGRAGLNPQALLALAALCSKRRSSRATRRAKLLLPIIDQAALSDGERRQFELLATDYLSRNPDARWSRHNRMQFIEDSVAISPIGIRQS